MGIDKARQDDLSGHVDFPLSGVGTHTYDQPFCHSNVPVADLVAEYIDVGGIFQYQVGLLPSGSHLHDPQFLVKLAVDFAGVALRCHAEPSFSYKIWCCRPIGRPVC